MKLTRAPLNSYSYHKLESTFNKLYTFLHIINISLIIYYRLSTLFNSSKTHNNVLLLRVLVFGSEIFLSFYSLLGLAYGWRRVTSTAFPEKLPEDDKLPCIDVLIFTSDPEKEPALHVMNTVISAMSLDYPPEKLTVYLSDDGGSHVILQAAKDGLEFARWWIPFCRKYRVKTTCPRAYFDEGYDGNFKDCDEYFGDRKMIEEKYKVFQAHLQRTQEKAQSDINGLASNQDHAPLIEVIGNGSNPEIPSLIYVAREKRPSQLHHFKAGALNALLRVSAIITNSPYILALDSDMYSNDPSSARQSMCFHLDPNLSTFLAFVQFPQMFRNINHANDIYDGQIRHIFQVKWTGMNGLEGPILSGTCFYIKREALYGDIYPKGFDLPDQLKQQYGLSNEFIKSLQQKNSVWIKRVKLSDTQLSEATFLASSMYEQNTKWGEGVGFLYASVVEDYFTSFNIHCRGWKSVFCNPERPAFLGTATINLNEALIQSTRWTTGFVDVACSRFFPLFYGPFVKKLSLLQSMCYASLSIQPLCCLPFWCLAIFPQLCLLLGIPLYPKATSPWFAVFSFAFLSSLFKNLFDVLITRGLIKTWWNEERYWLMKAVTSSLYGSVDAVMKKIGLKQASFTTTNKADDREKIELYNKGEFDFRASDMFIIPLATLVIFNLTSFIGGVSRVIFRGRLWDEFLGQICLSFFVILIGYPVIEGMLVRNDSASIPVSVSVKSALFACGILIIGSVFLCG